MSPLNSPLGKAIQVCGLTLMGAVTVGLTGGAAEAFVQSTTSDGVPIRWPSRCVRWRLNEQGSDEIGFDALKAAFDEAFGVWQAVECSDFSFIYDGLTAFRDVGYFNGQANSNIIVFHDEPGTWPNEPEVIALATVTFCQESGGSVCPFKGAIIDADIEFNGETFQFTVSDRLVRSTFDVWNTAAHEIGHVAGLDHTPETEATMFYTAPAGERSKRTLHADDVEGLCAIYPQPADGAEDACAAAEPAGDYADEVYDTDGGAGSCDQSGGAPAWALSLLVLLGLRRRRA